MGPLTGWSVYSYIADRFSSWPTAIALKDTSATSAENAILKDRISIFGVLNVSATDRYKNIPIFPLSRIQ